MEIGDLDRDERRALVALVEFLGATNREITDEESGEIQRIAEAIGPDHYREIVADVDARVSGEPALRELLQTVVRQEARELIYGICLELAVSDTIQRSESDLLDWLAGAWDVKVAFETPPELG